MINQFSFSQHSKECNFDKKTQYLLMFVYMARCIREIGKLSSITGTVSAVASLALGYSSKSLLKATVAGAVTWFACHQIYQTLAPQTKLTIENAQKNVSFSEWFNRELQILNTEMQNNKTYWITINSHVLSEKYQLSYSKEEMVSYIRSIVVDKSIQFSLLTISLNSGWLCIIHPKATPKQINTLAPLPK